VIEDYFESPRVSSKEMDLLWSLGFRHFGTRFFRYDAAEYNDKPVKVLPLRIDLAQYRPSKSQKRIIRRNRDLKVVFRDAFIDEEKIQLFEIHKKKFKTNIPDSIFDFVSAFPSKIPCHTVECCLYHVNKLVAVGFMDIGATATSAVYSFYDMAYNKRSLGIYMILSEITYSMESGIRHFYHGYAYEEDSFYDYKKNFTGLKYYDWTGEWNAF
jgi:leucyl-tRNA---protein transferase